MWNSTPILLLILSHNLRVIAVIGVEPSISFFDGNDYMNQCKTRLERRITGLSGVIYSHSLYGRAPYNASRNCFMMLIAPIGYRIRLKVLDFEVNGKNSLCEKDTLHVFDHETVIEPSSSQLQSTDTVTPGPIIGQFCGKRSNISELSISTLNALTLWWHTDSLLPQQHPAKGFRLHWNAFRVTANVPCSSTREFACSHNECIPLQLACDRYSDCRDESDTIYSKQLTVNCENLDIDPLTSVSGFLVLLLSGSIVLLCGCICISCCICCRCLKSIHPPHMKGEPVNCEANVPPPIPPQFFPPSPPKIPLPSATSSFTPRKFTNLDTGNPIHDGGYRSVQIANEYGNPINTNQQHDYTYVKNDVHRNLL
ncbi:Low-density lipoprotein receptor domain class A [Dictyocaulus viviparus]|uniref:Low-density lipoprotein receptor domain class A n=1 Tax=Dictyocaulus viviparus TaxID=29172 RepID=A0A0D8XFX2_DICVI|nr:Low-density lipoprotein receptor domain class A [Dictyocaulus viviparus]